MQCPECKHELEPDDQYIKMANEFRCTMCQDKLNYEKLLVQDQLPSLAFIREVFKYGDTLPIFLDVTSCFIKNAKPMCGHLKVDITRTGWAEAYKQFPYLPQSLNVHDVHISQTFFDCWRTACKDSDTMSEIFEQLKWHKSGMFLGSSIHLYERRQDFFCILSAKDLTLL